MLVGLAVAAGRGVSGVVAVGRGIVAVGAAAVSVGIRVGLGAGFASGSAVGGDPAPAVAMWATAGVGSRITDTVVGVALAALAAATNVALGRAGAALAIGGFATVGPANSTSAVAVGDSGVMVGSDVGEEGAAQAARARLTAAMTSAARLIRRPGQPPPVGLIVYDMPAPGRLTRRETPRRPMLRPIHLPPTDRLERPRLPTFSRNPLLSPIERRKRKPITSTLHAGARAIGAGRASRPMSLR